MTDNKSLFPTAYKWGEITLSVPSRELSRRELSVELSPTQFAVLHVIVQASWRNPGKSVSSVEIWKTVWPEMRDPDPTAINNRISQHISRIEKNFDLEFIEWTGSGYELSGKVEDATPPEPEFLVLNRIIVATTIATTMAMIVTVPTRALLAQFDLTLTQPSEPALILGGFHGVFGSLLWSGSIATGLLYLWFVFNRYNPWETRFVWLLSSGVGAAMGLFGSLFVDLGLLFAQRPETLVKAGWILTNTSSRWTALSVTGLGWSMPWLGAVIGGSCGFTMLWIVRKPQWAHFLASHSKLTNLKGTLRVFGALFLKATAWGSVFILIPMLAAACLLHSWLHNPPEISRFLGEGFAMALSGIGFIAGLLFALYGLTKGTEIAGAEKCSLSPVVEGRKTEVATLKRRVTSA